MNISMIVMRQRLLCGAPIQESLMLIKLILHSDFSQLKWNIFRSDLDRIRNT